MGYVHQETTWRESLETKWITYKEIFPRMCKFYWLPIETLTVALTPKCLNISRWQHEYRKPQHSSPNESFLQSWEWGKDVRKAVSSGLIKEVSVQRQPQESFPCLQPGPNEAMSAQELTTKFSAGLEWPMYNNGISHKSETWIVHEGLQITDYCTIKLTSHP